MQPVDFTKDEARKAKAALEEMFNLLPKTRRVDASGYYNTVYEFLFAAEKIAPDRSLPERKTP